MQRVLSFPPSSRGWGDQREFVSKRMCFAFMFALGFLAFLGGFLLGRFVFDKELELSRIKFKEASRNKEKFPYTRSLKTVVCVPRVVFAAMLTGGLVL